MMVSVRFSFVAVLALLAGCGASARTVAPPPKPSSADAGEAAAVARVPLTIRTARGDRRFTIEVARTGREQERGLMFRERLDPDGGMIFPFAPPRPASFWMRNTVIPLDLLFIRADGRIARIATNAVPYSLDLIESGEPVAAVLEIAGGRAAALGIVPGDIVRWPG